MNLTKQYIEMSRYVWLWFSLPAVISSIANLRITGCSTLSPRDNTKSMNVITVWSLIQKPPFQR